MIAVLRRVWPKGFRLIAQKIMRFMKEQMIKNAKTERMLRDIRSKGHASIAMRGRADAQAALAHQKSRRYDADRIARYCPSASFKGIQGEVALLSTGQGL